MSERFFENKFSYTELKLYLPLDVEELVDVSAVGMVISFVPGTKEN